MTTILDIQKRLTALGYDVGKPHGIIGSKTLTGMDKALDALSGSPVKSNPAIASKFPVSSQPKASRSITEIIIHCTATPEGRDVSVETIRG